MFREEYPRPIFIRTDWQTLNGSWDFEIADGSARNLSSYLDGSPYNSKIEVPFAPQAPLSGINYNQNLKSVWYRRTFVIDDYRLDGRVLLNFGAVDYRAEVYINGRPVGCHRGGYTPFTMDITAFVQQGDNYIVVNALDDDQDICTPSGNQGSDGYPHCTGIWQSVWLEFSSKTYISAYRATAVVSQNAIIAQGYVVGVTNGSIGAEVFVDGVSIAKYKYGLKDRFYIKIPIKGDIALWEVGNGKLYDVILTLLDEDGKQLDCVLTYTAFRSIEIKDKAFCVNGKPLTIKQITDHRFYGFGHYTAPSEAAIKQDLLCVLSSGFNSIRIQNTVAEPLYLYYADKLGLLVFAEYPSPSLCLNKTTAALWTGEWQAILERDYGNPSVAGWLPVGGNNVDAEFVRYIHSVTTTADISRPIIDGTPHYATSFFDKRIHAKDNEGFLSQLHNSRNGGFASDKEAAKAAKQYPLMLSDSQLEQLPLFVSNITLPKDAYRNTALFKKYFAAYINALMSAGVAGFCFNSLFDTPSSETGFYTAERDFKFDRAAEPSIRRFLNQIK